MFSYCNIVCVCAFVTLNKKITYLLVYNNNQLPLAEIIELADDDLFFMFSNFYEKYHVLNALLTTVAKCPWAETKRHRSAAAKTSSVTESDAIVRMMYKDIYWLYLAVFLYRLL